MKKLTYGVMLAAAYLTCSQNGLGAIATDEKLFLEPHLAKFAGKVVYEGGKDLLPQQRHTFDSAVSVHIGTNLASTMQMVTQRECKVTGLASHLADVAASLKPNGSAIITSPASYATVFTVGKATKEEVDLKIKAALEKIGSSDDVTLITQTLNGLEDVARATFIKREGKLQLLTDEKMLSIGEKVWRKNPDGARLEIYHSEEEYLVAIRQAGLFCDEIKRPSFQGEVKWNAYNKAAGGAVLGIAYKDHNPFTIYSVVKKGA